MGIISKIKKQSSTASRLSHQLNISTLQFITRYIWLTKFKAFSEGEIFALALMDPKLSHRDLQAYTSKAIARPVYRELNASNARALIDDKDLFHHVCETQSLAAVPVLARLSREDIDAIAREFSSGNNYPYLDLLARLPVEFVVKPSQGYHGDGILFLKKAANQDVCTWSGELVSPDALLELLRQSISVPTMPLAQGADSNEKRRSSTAHVLLFQPLVQAHPDLYALSGRQQMQSLRICTTLNDSGKATIHFVFLKLLAGQNMQDNFAQGINGNMLAYMEEHSGRIFRAIYRDTESGLMRVAIRHPKTNVEFEGFQVPFWHEACELALNAAKTFKATKAVGWDIGLTPDGPMLLEGNGTWDPLAPLYKNFPGRQELEISSHSKKRELRPVAH